MGRLPRVQVGSLLVGAAIHVEKSYDFLIRGKFLEPTGKVSRAKLAALVGALQQLGDIPRGFDIERLILPGVTQLTD